MFSRPSPRRDFLFIVCASISWGTVGIANQFVFAASTTNALSLTFFRLAIATPLFLLAGGWALGRRFFAIKKRDLLLMMLMGSLLAGSQACYVASIAATGVSVATLIAICASPVIIALLSRLLIHERLKALTLLALFAALGGTLLLTIGPPSQKGAGSASLLGVLLAFLSAGGYAGFIFCGRLLTGGYHPLQISAISFATGTLLLFVCALPGGLVIYYPASGWLALLYLGCVPTALGYGLFQVGIRSLSATVASIVTMCEPLTAAILAWLFFHEELGIFGLLGALLLLGAMALIMLVPGKQVA